VWGGAWIIAFLAVLNSTFGNQNAATAAITRIWYAMGRIRLFPSALTHTSPVHRTPDVAIFAQFIWTIVVGIVLGLKYGPINGFILSVTVVTAVMIGIYIVINLSSILYYLREQRSEFNWFLHGLLPIAGIVFLIPVLLASLGIGKQFLSFVSPLPYPISLTGPIVAVWFAAGIVYLIYLQVRHPERLQETGRIFVEDAESGIGAVVTEPATV
jgi:amino acid transporter